jgi:hypothetical protein
MLAIHGGSFLGQQVLTSGWSAKNKPTATVEFLRDAESSGKLQPTRGFNYDNWGGYIFYKLGTPVFIDDRLDFYGEEFYTRYSIVSLAQPGWRQQLNGDIYKGTPQGGSSIQWILMPKTSKIAAVLRDDPSWGPPVKEDEASALFVRKDQHEH